jgi:hypothetical protein
LCCNFLLSDFALIREQNAARQATLQRGDTAYNRLDQTQLHCTRNCWKKLLLVAGTEGVSSQAPAASETKHKVPRLGPMFSLGMTTT